MFVWRDGIRIVLGLVRMYNREDNKLCSVCSCKMMKENNEIIL